MASLVATTISQPAGRDLLSPVRSDRLTKKRRQYHSCDACRRGRRACDAHHAAAQACSNCSKTGKRCTFDWLRKLAQQEGKRRRSATSERSALDEPCASSYGDFVALSWPTSGHSLGMPLDGARIDPAGLDNGSILSSARGDTMHNFTPPEYANRIPMPHTTDPRTRDPRFPLSPADEYPHWAAMPTNPQTNQPSAPPSSRLSTREVKNQVSPATTAQSSSVPRKRARTDEWPNRFDSGAYQTPSSSTARSCSQGLNDRLAITMNKSMIAESLVKVYSDSFEHLLSCWAAKSACPYNMLASRSRPTGKATLNQDPESYFKPQLRFHEMVCRLDSKLGPLERSYHDADTLAAKRALQKTIMAFASQWSPRNQAQRSSSLILEDENADETILGTPQSFNRVIQDSLWHEADRSIQALANNMSFCAIFAQIVFALTAPPISVDAAPANVMRSKFGTSYRRRTSVEDFPTPVANHAASDTPSSRRKDSCNSDIIDLIVIDGPPACLEVALRHLHSWRRTLARNGAELAAENRQTLPNTAISIKPTPADMESFSLLFWFGVMCDTTAAAISNRPLVISDEDCTAPPDPRETIDTFEATSAFEPTLVASNSKSPENLTVWRLELLQRRVHNYLDDDFRWPCSLAEAAIRLRDGTQIKVLLFRRVTYLQSLVYRRVTTTTVEDAVQDTLQVYESFNATYGRFLSDCMRDHSNLPARFQSWYIILAAHWNLGVLLLADAIEAIDQSNKAEAIQREIREHSSLASQIRNSSANLIADLARASCSSKNSSAHHSIDQDFAFSDGAFLTEPWAYLLVRALARAASVFLDFLADTVHERTPSAEGFDELSKSPYYRQAADCISGLYQLGPNSDMAYVLAVELAKRLRRLAEIDSSSDEEDGLGDLHNARQLDFTGCDDVLGTMTAQQFTAVSDADPIFAFEGSLSSNGSSDQEVIDSWPSFDYAEMTS